MVYAEEKKFDRAEQMLEQVMQYFFDLYRGNDQAMNHPDILRTKAKLTILRSGRHTSQSSENFRADETVPRTQTDHKVLEASPFALKSEGGFCGTPLAAACQSGQLEVVKYFIKQGADVNARNGAALRHAVRRGYLEVVRHLLSHHAIVSVMDPVLGTPLTAALDTGDAEIFKLLMYPDKNAVPDIDIPSDPPFGTSLQRAIIDGNEAMVSLLLNSGSKLGENKGFFGDALELAASMKRPEILRLTLSSEEDPPVLSFRNALLQAIVDGHEGTISMFLPDPNDMFAPRKRKLLQASFRDHDLEASESHIDVKSSNTQSMSSDYEVDDSDPGTLWEDR
ncbi:MAG: hypothetical protein Q9162_000859 [Coniocarpon cinnabarinum]